MFLNEDFDRLGLESREEGTIHGYWNLLHSLVLSRITNDLVSHPGSWLDGRTRTTWLPARCRVLTLIHDSCSDRRVTIAEAVFNTDRKENLVITVCSQGDGSRNLTERLDVRSTESVSFWDSIGVRGNVDYSRYIQATYCHFESHFLTASATKAVISLLMAQETTGATNVRPKLPV